MPNSFTLPLNLAEHPAALRDATPDLAALLQRSAMAAPAAEFIKADASAGKAQAGYRRWMSNCNLAVFVTAVLCAFGMLVDIVFVKGGHPGLGKGLSSVAALGATLAAAFGAFGLYWLREKELLKTWMAQRARAEALRMSYFEAVISNAAATGTGPLLRQALDYLERSHLVFQKEYYEKRGASHRASADRTIMIGAVGATLAALASGSGTLSSFVTGSGASAASVATAWTGFLGVVGAATGAYAVGRELMMSDRRNAERYENTASALAVLAGKLDDVRAAADAGGGPIVVEFARAVNEQLLSEHRQWLEGQKGAEDGIARIETALAASKTAKPAQGVKPG